MKEKDLFNAINDIDLKYVTAVSKEITENEGGEEYIAEPVMVKSVRKSPMRIFGGAAACVGVVGAAAAVVVMSGSGFINTFSPLSSTTEASAEESAVSEAAAEESTVSETAADVTTALETSVQTGEENELLADENEEPWFSLKKEQATITEKEPIPTLENYLKKVYGEGAFKTDYIGIYSDLSRAEFMVSEKDFSKYGISPLGEKSSNFVVLEEITHTTDENGQNHYKYQNYGLIRSHNGNWYVPENLQSGSYSAEWTQEEEWEKLLEDEKKYYPNSADTDPLKAARNAAEYFFGNDRIDDSPQIVDCYYYEEGTDKVPYAATLDYYKTEALYKYGFKNYEKTKLVTVKFDPPLYFDSGSGDKYGIDEILYILLQDDEGIWHIEKGVNSSLSKLGYLP